MKFIFPLPFTSIPTLLKSAKILQRLKNFAAFILILTVSVDGKR